MYIRTDDEHNIVEVIFVGCKPDTNGYEIDMIDETILSDILNYKYIDGVFVKNDTDLLQKNIDYIKQIKINNMSHICQMIIEHGIDYNGSHYSLTTTDQINLMKLESTARLSPTTPILYHADGECCRIYTNDEIIGIADAAIVWITYNTTFFNVLKDQINKMTDVNDIVAIQYGMSLDDEHTSLFTSLTEGYNFNINLIEDNFDYYSLFPKIDMETISKYNKLNDDTQPDDPLNDVVDTESSIGCEGVTDVPNIVDGSDITDEIYTENPGSLV